MGLPAQGGRGTHKITPMPGVHQSLHQTANNTMRLVSFALAEKIDLT